MPRFEIQPMTDSDGSKHFTVVDLLDVSGNNEVAAFWNRSDARKFVAISNDWQDLFPYPTVSMGDEDTPYLSASARLVLWIFF